MTSAVKVSRGNESVTFGQSGEMKRKGMIPMSMNNVKSLLTHAKRHIHSEEICIIRRKTPKSFNLDPVDRFTPRLQPFIIGGEHSDIMMLRQPFSDVPDMDRNTA
jgi:hypothetical protein